MKWINRIPVIVGISILIGLTIFTIFGLILQNYINGFDPTPYISTISSLSIAILTVVYVLTTSGQLRIMQRQLNEMEINRQFESQPLPILTIKEAKIEAPRLFYSPPSDEHSFQSRLRIKFTIKNYSEYPAINIIISSLILQGKEKTPLIDCASERIEFLPAGHEIPTGDEIGKSFLFTNEKEEKIIPAFRHTKLEDLPKLKIRILFSNILGGCFSQESIIRLAPKNPDDAEKLTKWHALCVSFTTQYGEKVHMMEEYRKRDLVKEWEALFKSVKEELATETGKEPIDVNWTTIPRGFKIKSITTAEYNQEIENARFSHEIPMWVLGCVAPKKKTTDKDSNDLSLSRKS